MRHILLVLAGAVLLVVALGFIQGCGNEQPTEPIESNKGPDCMGDSAFAEDYGQKGEAQPMVAKLGASMTIGWPFWCSKDGWIGVSGVRTDAWTHVGAEYYARDLSHPILRELNIGVYSGFAGQVVRVYKTCPNAPDCVNKCNGGYGNEVVIYDWNRHVAVRYAHLSFVAVQLGEWVRYRQYIGKTGLSGCTTGPHLHIVGFENIDHFYLNGYPVIPTTRDSDYYACIIYFY